MSRGPRSSADPDPSWRPTASWPALRRRAEILAQIRAFFAARGVLEVETPLLAAATVTDLHLASLSCTPAHWPEAAPGAPRFLQTSPEFAMKRLLAAGSGPIYQLCKAFRDGESGRLHNPEFTLLEWYRPGFDHHALMDEVDELLAALLGTPRARRTTYGELFGRRLGVDPHTASAAELRRVAEAHGIEVAGLDDAATGDPAAARDPWLHLLLTHLLEPELGRGRPDFLCDFPASQAALARLRPGSPPVAERFELYLDGVELANGFHELADPAEQRRRFTADLAARAAAGLPQPPLDERLLAALAAGLPDCAGVALGVDRLVMLAIGASSLDETLAFPAARA